MYIIVMAVIVNNNIARYGKQLQVAPKLQRAWVKVMKELLPFSEKDFTCEGGEERVHASCKFAVNIRTFKRRGS